MVEVTGVAALWESAAPNFSKSVASPWTPQHSVSVAFSTSQPGKQLGRLRHPWLPQGGFSELTPSYKAQPMFSPSTTTEPKSPSRAVPLSRMGHFKKAMFFTTWRCSLQGHRDNLPVSPDCGRCFRACQTSEAPSMASVGWDESVCLPCD